MKSFWQARTGTTDRGVAEGASGIAGCQSGGVIVGWVERSETHRCGIDPMGFVALPIPLFEGVANGSSCSLTCSRFAVAVTFRRPLRFMPPCMRRALASDSVTLSESTISWSTVKYATSAENGSRQRVARQEDHRRSHVQDPRARESLSEGNARARIWRAHSFHHLQADRPRTTLSHGSRRALRDQRPTFFITTG